MESARCWVAQVGADPLITPALQDGFVAEIGGAGVELDYPVYEGMGISIWSSPSRH